MVKHVIFKAETLNINFTSYALAKMSNGLFIITESNKENDVLTLKHYLYCASIELGLKASILSVINSKDVKDELKYKIGHDLIKVNSLFIKKMKYSILDYNDLVTITKINPFYKNKGLEYITTPVIFELMTGTPNIPDLKDVKSVAEKINKHLLDNKLYINL